jgi:hypothetical protein
MAGGSALLLQRNPVPTLVAVPSAGADPAATTSDVDLHPMLVIADGTCACAAGLLLLTITM